MTVSGAVVVFLASLTALPVSYIWDTLAHFKDQRLLLFTSSLSFGLVAAVPWFVLRKKVQRVDHFCVLCLLLFQSVLSLVVAMENDGLIAEFMGYYLREGEPYLKTAHGTMISYWDGIAHYGMYLMMLAAVSWKSQAKLLVNYPATTCLKHRLDKTTFLFDQKQFLGPPSLQFGTRVTRRKYRWPGLMLTHVNSYAEVVTENMGTNPVSLMCHLSREEYYILFALGYYDVGLYWAGSFGYSKLVLILAVLTGKDGARLPFLLNFPFLAICTVVLIRSLSEKYEECCEIQNELKKSTRKGSVADLSIWKRPVDLAFVVYYGFASCFTLFRFVAAMDGNFASVKFYCERVEPYLTDPLPYAKAQLMVQTFYFIPYNILRIYSLLRSGQSWVTRWSLVYAGAAAQGEFSFMGSSFHYRTPYIHRLPQTGLARTLFWILNGLMFAVPQMAALRCLNNPDFYLEEQDQEPSNTEQAGSAHSNGTNIVVINSPKKVD